MLNLEHKTKGDRIPDATFPVRPDGNWHELTSGDLFKDRTVIVFALPGAFTPTCSTSHLPGFSSNAGEFFSHGIDAIYCLSVNDWFVMDAWRNDLGVNNEVLMLPDGNGDFTRGMGMMVDKRHLGFGERSWRYAMIVRDGIIQDIFVENTADDGDPFEVSGAPQLLDYLSLKSAGG
ncbi:MAG TPA: hypothetical protein DIT35_06775 [Rhodospirillaceae bacterium]|jgi:peroxiredoxin|nr:hypothetical protein [Rhodospirillaceae bacterium]